MAYSQLNMNNIGGSMGTTNLWIYSEVGTAKATVNASGYLDDAADMGIRSGDGCIVLVAEGIQFVMLTNTAGVITMTDHTTV